MFEEDEEEDCSILPIDCFFEGEPSRSIVKVFLVFLLLFSFSQFFSLQGTAYLYITLFYISSTNIISAKPFLLEF